MSSNSLRRLHLSFCSAYRCSCFAVISDTLSGAEIREVWGFKESHSWQFLFWESWTCSGLVCLLLQELLWQVASCCLQENNFLPKTQLAAETSRMRNPSPSPGSLSAVVFGTVCTWRPRVGSVVGLGGKLLVALAVMGRLQYRSLMSPCSRVGRCVCLWNC